MGGTCPLQLCWREKSRLLGRAISFLPLCRSTSQMHSNTVKGSCFEASICKTSLKAEKVVFDHIARYAAACRCSVFSPTARECSRGGTIRFATAGNNAGNTEFLVADYR